MEIVICDKCGEHGKVEYVYGNEWVYWCWKCEEWRWIEEKDLEDRIIEGESK